MKKNRQRGNKLGFLIFDFYLSLGIKHAYALLYFVCLYYLFFDFKLKKKSAGYISLRFPDAKGFKKNIHLYKLFINTGKNLIDLRQLDKRPDKVQFKCDNDLIIRILKEGNGLLMLSSHTGNWQIMMRKLPDFKVKRNVVMQLNGFEDVNEFLKIEGGGEFGINIIDADNGMDASLKILSELADGNIVSIMADRGISSAKNISVNFFNETLLLPKGPFLIAAVSCSPIVQLIPFRNADCSYKLETYRIDVPNCKNSNEKINKIAEMYIANIESFLLQHPYEWNATSLT